MRRPIHSPQAERTHLLLVAYQAAMAEQQALVAREQQVLEEIEARKILAIEADTTIARDAFPAECVKTDGGRDAGSVLTTQYGRPAQMEAGSSVERHLLRMSLELIAGETLSVKDGYVFPVAFFFSWAPFRLFWPQNVACLHKVQLLIFLGKQATTPRRPSTYEGPGAVALYGQSHLGVRAGDAAAEARVGAAATGHCGILGCKRV